MSSIEYLCYQSCEWVTEYRQYNIIDSSANDKHPTLTRLKSSELSTPLTHYDLSVRIPSNEACFITEATRPVAYLGGNCFPTFHMHIMLTTCMHALRRQNPSNPWQTEHPVFNDESSFNLQRVRCLEK